jgi:aminopeptidase N
MRARIIYLLLLLFWSVVSNAQRLPEGVVPVRYTLAFTPDLALARFEGHEEIDIKLSKSTRTITLNAVELDFKKVVVRSLEGTQNAEVIVDAPHETASFQLPSLIAAGDAVLEIDFSGTLNDKLRGFYLTHGKDRDYASTQFEPTDARRAFPSFDEPALKATFDISLTIDQGDTAISNGAITSDTPGPGSGKHTLRFAITSKMSTYLVAMAVGDWKCLEGGTDGIPIRICATPDKIALGGFALTASEHILHSLNQYFRIPYPYKKLDLLAVPDFEAGAMENPAAITFRESCLLVDEKNSSVAARKTVTEIVAHEIVHMWFGDLVTMKWWDDVWLNEGFATWMTSKPVADWKPGWNEFLEDVQATSGTLNVDSSPATRQIRAQANTPDEINQLFDGIAYGKAAAVLHMVEAYVGPEVFRAGVNEYLDKYAYGNATAEDFWNTLAKVSNKPVAKIMRSFVDEPGAPLISVRARCSGNKMVVNVTQKRFYLQGSLMETPAKQIWSIPVCFRLDGHTKDCRILDQKEQEFEFDSCSSGLTADADGSGYYRTQYASDALDHLPGDGWTVSDRARLVGDTWALVLAGKESVGDYLGLVDRAGAAREVIPIETVLDPLRSVGNYLVTAADQDKYSEFIRTLIEPAANRLGWKPSAGDTDKDRELRPVVIALLGNVGRDRAVIEQAQKLAEMYLQERASVDPSLVGVALQLAARTGGPALFDQYYEATRTAKSPEEYLNFLYGLAAFSDPLLAQRTFKLALSPEIRSQDAPSVIAALINHQETRTQVWEWTKEHWPEIHAKLTTDGGARIVAATGAFCDVADRDDVQTFFTAHSVVSSDRALALALRRIDACVDFRTQQSQQLASWLDNFARTKRENAGSKGERSTGSTKVSN